MAFNVSQVQPLQNPNQTNNPYQNFPFSYNPKPLVNTAQVDPYLQEYLNTWKQRVSALQADEGSLKKDFDTRTNQMVSQATGDIADRAAGAGAALSEDAARRGIGGTGTESGLRSDLSGSSQREQARAATSIGVARGNEYENQRMNRQNALNNFIGGGLGAASSIGQNMLAQQGLGLQQYQAQGAQGERDLEGFLKGFQFRQQNPQLQPGRVVRPPQPGRYV